MSAAVSETWMEQAITDGIAEWTDSRPQPPDEHEKTIYRFAFASGVDAALRRVCDALTRDDE